MAVTVMFLSPATSRISPGSLVTTVIWSSGARLDDGTHV